MSIFCLPIYMLKTYDNSLAVVADAFSVLVQLVSQAFHDVNLCWIVDKPWLHHDLNVFAILWFVYNRYATEVDVDFVRKSVRAIGRCAIKVEQAAERCVSTLLDLIQTKVNYVVQEAIVVIKASQMFCFYYAWFVSLTARVYNGCIHDNFSFSLTRGRKLLLQILYLGRTVYFR